VERIIHYNSKDAMDIRGLGDAHVRKFFELGFLKDIPSIYHLPFDQIRKLEGYGAKSVDNLQQAIETSKTQPLHRLLYALGIRFVGETTAKTIAANINHLLDLEQKTVEELQQLEDIGPKVATAVFNFFHNADNIEMLHKLEQLGLQLNNNYRHNSTQGNLNGKTFLFTGTLPTLKRSEAEQLVEANGGSLLSGVSSKLNFLIVGQDAGSKLEKAKKIGTIQILDEASFLMLIQNNTGG
jgi:DNA ligase (NAD+)